MYALSARIKRVSVRSPASKHNYVLVQTKSILDLNEIRQLQFVGIQSSICRFEIEFIAECNSELTKNGKGFESRTHSKGTLENFIGRFQMYTNGNQRPQRDCNDRSMKYYEWNRNCRKTQIYCYGVGKLNISIVLSKRNSKLFGCLRVS